MRKRMGRALGFLLIAICLAVLVGCAEKGNDTLPEDAGQTYDV